ncbi:hypothetical protein Btru_044184 [Bulinus truncatus]|nr:hypothetical protein Btru_044184 [Bulinus truncatus]
MAKKQEVQKWSPRTTRTLLTTCLIFAANHAINSIISMTFTFDIYIGSQCITVPRVTRICGNKPEIELLIELLTLTFEEPKLFMHRRSKMESSPAGYSSTGAVFGPESYLLLVQQFLCFVNPTFALFGMVVNGMCLAILAKSGLNKPTNILLFTLVVADSMNMFVNINFPLMLLYFGPIKTKRGYCTWEYDTDFNLFLYNSLQLFSVIGLWGRLVNGTIPVIITLERILAVYLPVTFKKLVTTRSTMAVCLLCYIFWLPAAILNAFLRRFASFQLSNGKLVTGAIASDFLRQNFALLNDFYGVGLETLASWFPSCFICVGCVLIGIKVKMSMYRRRKLTKMKEKKWSVRTTRTLLTTCLIFSFSHAFSAIVSLTSAFDPNSYLFFFFTTQLSQFISAVQCFSNFFVYVISNKSFWLIFVKMLGLQNKQK